MRTQLLTGQADGHISGREPDPVPRCITAVTVCANFLAQYGALKVDMGGLPCFHRDPESELGLEPGVKEDKTKNGSVMARRSVTSTAEHRPNKERDRLRRKS